MSVHVTQSRPMDGRHRRQRVAPRVNDLPPLFMACTAASMNGAAVPYGSRSTR